MKILVDAPINSLSLGNVSFNIIKELFEKGHEVAIWPVNEQNIDVSAYNMVLKIERMQINTCIHFMNVVSLQISKENSVMLKQKLYLALLILLLSLMALLTSLWA